MSFTWVSSAKWPVSKKMDSRIGHVASERLGTRRQEEGIVLSPYRQKAWLLRPGSNLECRVEPGIALVVAAQVSWISSAPAGTNRSCRANSDPENRGHVRHPVPRA